VKRIIGYLILFVLVMSISVLSHAPASFVYKHLPKVRGLQVTGLSGTIWHGQAQAVRWRGRSFGQVNWQFAPGRLLAGKLEYALRFGKGSDMQLRGKGQAGLGMNGPYAENLHASLPAANLVQFSPMPVPAEVQGQLELTLRSYHYAAPWCGEADGTLVWSGSRVDSMLGTLELGTILADVRCQDNQLSAGSDHDSPQASGAFSAELNTSRQYSLDAWFKPGAEFPPGMQAQLKWLGSPDGQGRYPFVFSGKF
jgi:general secretion pathway protein N